LSSPSLYDQCGASTLLAIDSPIFHVQKNQFYIRYVSKKKKTSSRGF
jgi:hypothetical protein